MGKLSEENVIENAPPGLETQTQLSDTIGRSLQRVLSGGGERIFNGGGRVSDEGARCETIYNGDGKIFNGGRRVCNEGRRFDRIYDGGGNIFNGEGIIFNGDGAVFENAVDNGRPLLELRDPASFLRQKQRYKRR